MAALCSFINGLGPYKSAANQDENNVEFWSIRPCRDSARSWVTPCSDLSTFYILRNTPKIPTRGDIAFSICEYLGPRQTLYAMRMICNVLDSRECS